MLSETIDQFNEVNPAFADKLINRIRKEMNPDHVWELQLGGPDVASNLHILDAFTNQDIGRQIRQQIRALPDYTPLRINFVGP